MNSQIKVIKKDLSHVIIPDHVFFEKKLKARELENIIFIAVP